MAFIWITRGFLGILLMALLAFVASVQLLAPLPITSTLHHHHRSIEHKSGPRFWIANDMFWKDGNPFQIIGGDLHYFRVLQQWDLGGFPAWLLDHQPPPKLRSSDPTFLHLVERWWGVLFPKVVPLLYCNGGPIIMIQIENEYGSYGDDKSYLHYLVNLARAHFRDDVILEFYTGWLTHWGEKAAETDAGKVASELDKILSKNGSAVLYMAHGGTNFGFFSGANTGENDSDYRPDITSYDYDAPISEAGDIDSPKFKALRDVIGRYSPNPLPAVPSTIERKTYGVVRLQKIELLSEPPEGHLSENPVTMESLQQTFGFILYQSTLPPRTGFGSTLSIALVHDRAQVFVARRSGNQHETPTFVGTIQRWSNSPLIIPNFLCVPGSKLFILGVLSPILLDGTPVHGWRIYPIPLRNITQLHRINQSSPEGPAFYRGCLKIKTPDEVKDTFISLRGWTKGVVFINGFNIGRFWASRGPQCTLYIPAPLLRSGENHLVILELEMPKMELEVTLVDRHAFTCGG